MRYLICLTLMLGVLTGCSTCPINATSKTIEQLAPDVPTIPAKIQIQAATEMQGGQCPAENTIIDVCLITRDEARAEK